VQNPNASQQQRRHPNTIHDPNGSGAIGSAISGSYRHDIADDSQNAEVEDVQPPKETVAAVFVEDVEGRREGE
jgi:hypothetical protein